MAGIAQYVNEGATLLYKATSAAVEYKQVIAFKNCIGVAATAIAQGDTGVVNLKGSFILPKKTSDTIKAGDIVYYASDKVQADKVDCVAGIALADAGSSDQNVLVRIG